MRSKTLSLLRWVIIPQASFEGFKSLLFELLKLTSFNRRFTINIWMYAFLQTDKKNN